MNEQSIYLSNLHTPVEQVLRANVVLIFSDVVQQTAVGHQLGDKLDGGGQADAEQTTHVRMLNGRHHIGLL